MLWFYLWLIGAGVFYLVLNHFACPDCARYRLEHWAWMLAAAILWPVSFVVAVVELILESRTR